ncbi:MAG: hypothetical protein A2X02_01325 [Bacteroidetes bacterium GWF2_29_10]|nr:MAG: hypothetical protein A2X02_01325 [Bacteroidetes bacterium GWF2_29_10]
MSWLLVLEYKYNVIMAKKIIKKSERNIVLKKSQITFGNQLLGKSSDSIFSKIDYKYQLIFFFVLSCIIYFNTLFNGYVLDDVISITQNKFVQQGLGGIKSILTKDSMYGFVGSETELTGGRYRPFPLIIFAIENQFFGNNPFIGHLLNIITWGLTVIVFFKLLSKYFFRFNPEVVFVASLIFAIHPIHTEVVANIKSRDEIISLLLLFGALYYLFKHLESNQLKYKVISYSAFFFALLSKEYGVTFLFIMPLALWTFSNIDSKKILNNTIPFIVIFIFYMLIRLSVVGVNNNASNELLNNPFLYASFTEKYSTIMVCLMKYLNLLVIPYPLSYDYRFNEIPIVGLFDLKVILSIIIHVALLTVAIINLKKRNVIAFIVFFYLFSIFIASNMLVEIGALMGERFLYQPSVAYSILIGIVFYFIYNKTNIGVNLKNILTVLLIITIFIPFSIYTFARNADWKSDIDLYIRDVKAVPNSAPANNSAGSSLINLSDFIKTDIDSIIKNKSTQYNNSLIENLAKVKKFYPNLNPQVLEIENSLNAQNYEQLNLNADKVTRELLRYSVDYFNKSLVIHPKYHDGLVNIFLAYIRLEALDTAEYYFKSLKTLNNETPGIDKARITQLNSYLASQFHMKGQKFAANNDLNNAIVFFEKATNTEPDNYRYWYDLGGASYTNKDYIKAFVAWEKAYKINPQAQEVVMGLKALGYKF